MATLPASLVGYFDDLVLGRLNPLLIALDDAARVTAWQGDGAAYGLDDLAVGIDLTATLPLLVGTLDALTEPTRLAFMATPNHGVAHLHLLPLAESGYGLILLEATQEHERQQARQQISHQLALANEQKTRLLRDLEQARAQLEKQNSQLAEAGMLKTLFMGRMSHEFRTPLASILGHAQLARSGQGELSRHLGAIHSGGQYLLALVENLLDQARMDNHELVLQPTRTDLVELAEGIGLMFGEQATQQGLTLDIETTDLPRDARLDGTRLRQVLINLLGNALKFTQRGQVVLAMSWREARLYVRVQDTGPGIPESMRERIFESFTQVSDDRSRKGAGLGLSISRALVERMGGTLRVTSPATGGSCFVFDISAPLAAPETVQTGNAQVLVVEDDADLRALIGVYLETAGFGTRFAIDGEQAVEAVATTPPDLVLMDMHLPRLDGPAATAAIRRLGYRGPVITLSAASEHADREAAAHAGGDAYLHKPVDPQLLLGTIRALLNDR